MSDDWNTQIVNEFRQNDGKVGGMFEGVPLLVLHSIGAKTGAERINPLMYQDVDGGYAVFASKAGADTNPDWYHNLVVNPDASIEIGSGTENVRARIADGEEYDQIWTTQKQNWPQFAEYEQKTSRSRIPVVVLEKQQ